MKYLSLLFYFLSCKLVLFSVNLHWVCYMPHSILAFEIAFMFPLLHHEMGSDSRRFHLYHVGSLLSAFHYEIVSPSPFSERGWQNLGVNQLETSLWFSPSLLPSVPPSFLPSFSFLFSISHFPWLVSLCKLDTNCTSLKKKKKPSPCYLLERVTSVGLFQ